MRVEQKLLSAVEFRTQLLSNFPINTLNLACVLLRFEHENIKLCKKWRKFLFASSTAWWHWSRAEFLFVRLPRLTNYIKKSSGHLSGAYMLYGWARVEKGEKRKESLELRAL
jgi:hypothetical protein